MTDNNSMKEEKELTHWKQEFNYDYLGAYSLQPKEEKILTIKELKKEKVKNTDGKEQECLVAKFVEPDVKPMILNKTNCKIIQNVYKTPHIEKWVGIRIIVYAVEVKAWGEVVDALRIKKTNPDENLIEEIKKQYELKKDKLTPEQKAGVERVINSKEERSYNKTVKFLNSVQ